MSGKTTAEESSYDSGEIIDSSMEDDSSSDEDDEDSSSFDTSDSDDDDDDDVDASSFQSDYTRSTNYSTSRVLGGLGVGGSHYRSGHSAQTAENVPLDANSSEVRQVQRLTGRETSNVRFWRVVVLGLLVCAGIAVTTSTYFFLRDAERSEFRERYLLFAHTISDAAEFHITNVHQAVRSMSDICTSGQQLTNAQFPYVTIPAFEMHGHHALQQSGIESMILSPLVQIGQREEWNNYSNFHQEWLTESRDYVTKREKERAQPNFGSSADSSGGYHRRQLQYITRYIYDLNLEGKPYPSPPPGPFMPIWQTTPPPLDPRLVNGNMVQLPFLKALFPPVSLTREGLFSFVFDLSRFSMPSAEHVAFHDPHGVNNVTEQNVNQRPHSILAQPVFRELQNSQSDVVGLLSSIVAWDAYLMNLLPPDVKGIFVVLRNTCGQAFTYLLNGQQALYLGPGDMHDYSYNDTEVQIPLFQYINNMTSTVGGHCEYRFYVYGSDAYKQEEGTSTLIVFTAIVAITFFVVVVTFLVYDLFVQRRNSKVVSAAARSNAILSSLFPSNVRDRLFAESEAQAAKAKAAAAAGGTGSSHLPAAKSRLRSFLDSDNKEAGEMIQEQLGYEGKPIADLFPDTTVMFADIAGFTAWSSVREPAQVFTLLETLYRAFDEIAKRRRVFKVETVGDCYVAVTGLPDPMKDHAVTMARFARDCMHRTRALTKKLETSLGPDTGDLNMRMGIHSGQVTGGVLRGERSRFQLFGDTMNTASRMESTGERGKIQISQETADLLVSAGKTEWISLREEKIVAKGKGEMQTYWLSLGECRFDTQSASMDTSSTHGSNLDHEEETHHTAGDQDHVGIPSVPADNSANTGATNTATVNKPFGISNSRTTRLIEWNVDVLLRLLKQVVARRRAYGEVAGSIKANETQFELQHAESGKTAIDEVKEIIALPQFNATVALRQDDADSINLSDEVVDQLFDYVSNIAAIYNENPFHNFEHASHVTMSVVKLLSRIVAPEIDYDENAAKAGKSLHDHTYGITSDPLTQFACVFSALIHDADHSGVPNAQLVKEHSHIAEFYKGKSVAEQNSVDLAWHLLMDDTYSELRQTIYHTDAELKRFRQLVVNSVMATDIVDKELKTLRNARWTKAFSEDSQDSSTQDAVNRKATIVIEHLIQASDVAHTMQHWHIYRKWNERFFLECYQAYKEGRAEKDPSVGWYKGEIGFFDFYIIPLAKKLKDCGVFGVSSDEYLNYAVRNRKEWEERGQEVVVEMIQVVNHKIGLVSSPPPPPPVPPQASSNRQLVLNTASPATPSQASRKKLNDPPESAPPALTPAASVRSLASNGDKVPVSPAGSLRSVGSAAVMAAANKPLLSNTSPVGSINSLDSSVSSSLSKPPLAPAVSAPIVAPAPPTAPPERTESAPVTAVETSTKRAAVASKNKKTPAVVMIVEEEKKDSSQSGELTAPSPVSPRSHKPRRQLPSRTKSNDLSPLLPESAPERDDSQRGASTGKMEVMV